MILNALQAGEGSPVVMLHGLFGAARNFGGLQRALASNHRVVVLDLRNHGDSPHAADMRYPIMASDVRETLQALGIDKAAVIGHSMGGKVAMAMALKWPERVGKLLVSDIAPVMYQHGNAAFTAAMRAIPLAPELTRRQADNALVQTVPDHALRQFLLQNLQLGSQPRWRIGLDEISAAVPDLEDWIDLPGAYLGPALFVTGANSTYVLSEHRAIIRAKFPSTRFVTIKHAGHWVHADNPGGFLSVVEAFLNNWV